MDCASGPRDPAAPALARDRLQDRETTRLIEFARVAAEAGLLASTCGNVSLRLDDARMVISASGAELGRLQPDDASLIDLGDGTLLSGRKPSMETALHRAVYRVRPAAGAVIHCQSRAATLLACHADPPRDLDFVPEVSAYVRAHAYVPYFPPGSGGLAEAVSAAFEDPEVTVVQMRNHGQVIAGGTWRAAVRRGTFFEMACWMATRGLPLRTIPPEDVAILRGYARDI